MDCLPSLPSLQYSWWTAVQIPQTRPLTSRKQHVHACCMFIHVCVHIYVCACLHVSGCLYMCACFCTCVCICTQYLTSSLSPPMHAAISWFTCIDPLVWQRVSYWPILISDTSLLIIHTVRVMWYYAYRCEYPLHHSPGQQVLHQWGIPCGAGWPRSTEVMASVGRLSLSMPCVHFHQLLLVYCAVTNPSTFHCQRKRKKISIQPRPSLQIAHVVLWWACIPGTSPSQWWPHCLCLWHTSK